MVLLQISQNSQKKHQKEIPLQMFSCEFSEIFHNTFFKEPFGRLLLHKHSALFTFIQGTFAFSKMMSYIFWLSIFSVQFVGWEQKWAQYVKP